MPSERRLQSALGRPLCRRSCTAGSLLIKLLRAAATRLGCCLPRNRQCPVRRGLVAAAQPPFLCRERRATGPPKRAGDRSCVIQVNKHSRKRRVLAPPPSRPVPARARQYTSTRVLTTQYCDRPRHSAQYCTQRPRRTRRPTTLRSHRSRTPTTAEAQTRCACGARSKKWRAI